MKDDAPYAEIVLGTMECARRNLERDGTLMMVVLFLRGTLPLNITPLQWDTDKEKWQRLFLCGSAMKQTQCDGLIVVSDAAIRRFDNISKEDLAYVKENVATEAPLTVPEGMLGRRECIIVQYLNPVSKISDMAVQAYRHEGADRSIVFEERIDQGYMDGMSMDGMIRDMVFDGYDSGMNLQSTE